MQQIDDLKKLVAEAENEFKLQSDYCQEKSFFRWRWKTPHQFGKWVAVGKVESIAKGVSGIVMAHECKKCGLLEHKTVKF